MVSPSCLSEIIAQIYLSIIGLSFIFQPEKLRDVKVQVEKHRVRRGMQLFFASWGGCSPFSMKH